MSVLPKEDKQSIDKPSHASPASELQEAPLGALGKGARELKLGDLTLNGRVFLAPMAGYTDTAFRRLARRYGAAMVVTEMVIHLAHAVIRASKSEEVNRELGTGGIVGE